MYQSVKVKPSRYVLYFFSVSVCFLSCVFVVFHLSFSKRFKDYFDIFPMKRKCECNVRMRVALIKTKTAGG